MESRSNSGDESNKDVVNESASHEEETTDTSSASSRTLDAEAQDNTPAPSPSLMPPAEDADLPPSEQRLRAESESGSSNYVDAASGQNSDKEAPTVIAPRPTNISEIPSQILRSPRALENSTVKPPFPPLRSSAVTPVPEERDVLSGNNLEQARETPARSPSLTRNANAQPTIQHPLAENNSESSNTAVTPAPEQNSVSSNSPQNPPSPALQPAEPVAASSTPSTPVKSKKNKKPIYDEPELYDTSTPISPSLEKRERTLPEDSEESHSSLEKERIDQGQSNTHELNTNNRAPAPTAPLSFLETLRDKLLKDNEGIEKQSSSKYVLKLLNNWEKIATNAVTAKDDREKLTDLNKLIDIYEKYLKSMKAVDDKHEQLIKKGLDIIKRIEARIAEASQPITKFSYFGSGEGQETESWKEALAKVTKYLEPQSNPNALIGEIQLKSELGAEKPRATEFKQQFHWYPDDRQINDVTLKAAVIQTKTADTFKLQRFVQDRAAWNSLEYEVNPNGTRVPNRIHLEAAFALVKTYLSSNPHPQSLMIILNALSQPAFAEAVVIACMINNVGLNQKAPGVKEIEKRINENPAKLQMAQKIVRKYASDPTIAISTYSEGTVEKLKQLTIDPPKPRR